MKSPFPKTLNLAFIFCVGITFSGCFVTTYDTCIVNGEKRIAFIVENCAGAHSALTLSAISPSEGGQAGGTLLTLTGTGFIPLMTVKVAENECTNLNVASMTQATCLTPASASPGTYSVTATRAGNETAALANAFTYLPSNRWATMSTENAPDARRDHTAIWTGSKMIVWGGVT